MLRRRPRGPRARTRVTSARRATYLAPSVPEFWTGIGKDDLPLHTLAEPSSGVDRHCVLLTPASELHGAFSGRPQTMLNELDNHR